MKNKIQHSISILLLLCVINASLYARDKVTATNFLSFSVGLTSSFIGGATAYQQSKFLDAYQTELSGLKYNVSASILPTTALSFGVKYGIPFNDKIMIFTGLNYTERGFTENFNIATSAGPIAQYQFQMIANYWDLYFGLKYKNETGITLGIGLLTMYNVKDQINIKRTDYSNGKGTTTNTQEYFHDYYQVPRNLFPAAPFVSVGYEQKWWQVELETSYTSNIFLATAVEMNFITVGLKTSFILLWD